MYIIYIYIYIHICVYAYKPISLGAGSRSSSHPLPGEGPALLWCKICGAWSKGRYGPALMGPCPRRPSSSFHAYTLSRLTRGLELLPPPAGAAPLGMVLEIVSLRMWRMCRDIGCCAASWSKNNKENVYMLMYIYIYIYMYIYIYVCIYIYIYMCIYTERERDVYMYVCMHVCMYVYIYIYM